MQTQSEYNHLVACMRDESVSATLYRRQADTGNAAAMAHLGRMYEDGRGGLTRDDAEAIQWYRRGAEAGNGQAMASLGYMYERGRGGLTKDVVEAGQWYRKGAARGTASRCTSWVARASSASESPRTAPRRYSGIARLPNQDLRQPPSA